MGLQKGNNQILIGRLYIFLYVSVLDLSSTNRTLKGTHLYIFIVSPNSCEREIKRMHTHTQKFIFCFHVYKNIVDTHKTNTI